MKALYKYPQSRFPYEELVQINAGRKRTDAEDEIDDTGISFYNISDQIIF